ncbi:MAG: OmpH family outer membrane protein [Nitrospirae bacterium]|nr:OmpH family outer membrane protein [Nitrospirota bacterium]
MKKLVTAVIAGVLLLAFNAYADNVGFINVQKLVSDSKMGKKATAEIQKLKDTENEKLNKIRAEFEKLKESFKAESQKQDANKEELKILIDKIQLKEKEFKRLADDSKELLAKKDRELVLDILQKADPLLKEIAKKNGYTIILKDRNEMAYLDPKVDITDEVIKKLDK